MVKDKSFYRSLLIVAIPAAFQSLISLSVNMLDNVMVGSLGDVSLAAVSLANQATALLTFLIVSRICLYAERPAEMRAFFILQRRTKIWDLLILSARA